MQTLLEVPTHVQWFDGLQRARPLQNVVFTARRVSLVAATGRYKCVSGIAGDLYVSGQALLRQVLARRQPIPRLSGSTLELALHLLNALVDVTETVRVLLLWNLELHGSLCDSVHLRAGHVLKELVASDTRRSSGFAVHVFWHVVGTGSVGT